MCVLKVRILKTIDIDLFYIQKLQNRHPNVMQKF